MVANTPSMRLRLFFSEVKIVSLKSKDAACSLVAAALPQLLRKPDATVDTRLLLAAG
jgi:hypothetical protein